MTNRKNFGLNFPKNSLAEVRSLRKNRDDAISKEITTIETYLFGSPSQPKFISCRLGYALNNTPGQTAGVPTLSNDGSADGDQQYIVPVPSFVWFEGVRKYLYLTEVLFEVYTADANDRMLDVHVTQSQAGVVASSIRLTDNNTAYNTTGLFTSATDDDGKLPLRANVTENGELATLIVHLEATFTTAGQHVNGQVWAGYYYK